jgi:voltage-gated potassium channel Kch
MSEPGFRGLPPVGLILLIVGMFFYSTAQRWALSDSLSFSVITLTTVGYGDFSPETVAGRTFTIFYVFAGVGVIIALVTETAANAAADARHRRSGTTEAPGGDRPAATGSRSPRRP